MYWFVARHPIEIEDTKIKISSLIRIEGKVQKNTSQPISKKIQMYFPPDNN